MRDALIESGVLRTLAAETHPAATDARPFCAFCEALLRLEWPGRPCAVTPAPLAEWMAPEADVRGVLDVTIGPAGDDGAMVTFRLVVHDEVARREWIVAAAVLLETARSELGRSRSRGTTGR